MSINEGEELNNSDSDSRSGARQLAKSATKKVSKKVVEEVATSTAQKSLMVTAAPLLAGVAVVVLVVVIAIGTAVFLHTLPGVAMSKLKAYGKKMANNLASWFGESTIEQVDEEIIYNTLDYLDNMGYDLKGYGFITDYKSEEDVGDNEYLDEKDGVVRNKDTDGIVKAESDFVMAYLISDNYIYTLANENLDINFGEGILEWLAAKGVAIGRHFVDFFGGSLGPHWTSGLLTLWNEDGGIGHRGGYYSDSSFLNFDDVSLDPEENILYIKRGFGGTNSMYKLDGWSGRYGMPMEFLLSIHLATLMPDLSYDMANSFETKLNMPYLENVINHWFRNVYFTNVSYDENNEPDGSTLSFVDYNYQYEEKMKERWTLYETDKNGNEYLYVLKDKGDGTYAQTSADVDSYKTTKITQKDGYYIYTGTKEEAQVENVSVAKKAITQNSNDAKYLEDLKWNENNGVWSAYAEIGDDVVQKGDAQRGETNSKIKKMFLENTYFRYDGTEETAKVISELRREYDIGYGALDEKFNVDKGELANKKISIDVGNGRKTYSIEDVSGKVMLTQDSLNAFTMLENTNTLDADYIYRDFKELVVELGYFEKEELTDETPRLLGWIVPDVGSKDYPQRGFDKVENEFGTLLHSNGDINALKKVMYWSQTTVDPIEYDPDAPAYELEDMNPKGLVGVVDSLQSVSGKKRKLLGAGKNGPAITNDFLAAGFDDVDIIVRDWAAKFKLVTASNYYEKYNKEQYVEWLNNLGGVFAEYAGPDVKGNGDLKSFIDAEKYVYGLMWIAGFEYCGTNCWEPGEGEGLMSGHKRCDPIMDAWYEAGSPPGTSNWDDVFEYKKGANGEYLLDEETGMPIPEPANPYDAYNGASGVGHSHVNYTELPNPSRRATLIDDVMLEQTFTTDCAATTYKVYDKAGLIGDGSDERPTTIHFNTLVKDYGAKVVTEPCDLRLGDIVVCFSSDWNDNGSLNPDDWPQSFPGVCHWFFVGEETEDTVTMYTTGHDFTHTGNFRRVVSKKADKSEIYSSPWRGIHCWDLESSDNKYNGYKGNEDVVSPVTGVLLDYGTYGDLENKKASKDERINADLKYENYLAELKAQGEDLKYAIPRQEYLDKVGYAKIMVLDTKNYKKLESAVNNRWSNNSLVSNGNNGTIFRDDLKNEGELGSFSELEETVYGYKEFLEDYEKYGIAGNIIYVDGFECEKRDPNFNQSDTEGVPHGEKIDWNFFNVSPGNIGSADEKLNTKYRGQERYTINSKEAEDKVNAEIQVKELASPSIKAGGLTFIKEGTILGRTITDRELIEVKRKNELGTYAELRENSLKDIVNYNVIGNYLRIIMRDATTDTVVENVEDYIKLDKLEEQ